MKEYITKREIFDKLVEIRSKINDDYDLEDVNYYIMDLETSILQDVRSLENDN